MHSLRLEFPCPDAVTACAVRDAVAVESRDGPGGSRIEVAAEGAVLLLRIEADEEGNLKAALHGTLRLADMALRALCR
ncbi:MAG TPA: KEOPS complex subunit Pcc1 [Candidatus Thermoplasmatota archaeon]|nr:KEOPS complex subunit Pcc1 [Candidatus Thermoplasmatota archaeon]